MEIGPHVFPKSGIQTHRQTKQLYIYRSRRTVASVLSFRHLYHAEQNVDAYNEEVVVCTPGECL